MPPTMSTVPPVPSTKSPARKAAPPMIMSVAPGARLLKRRGGSSSLPTGLLASPAGTRTEAWSAAAARSCWSNRRDWARARPGRTSESRRASVLRRMGRLRGGAGGQTPNGSQPGPARAKMQPGDGLLGIDFGAGMRVDDGPAGAGPLEDEGHGPVHLGRALVGADMN